MNKCYLWKYNLRKVEGTFFLLLMNYRLVPFSFHIKALTVFYENQSKLELPKTHSQIALPPLPSHCSHPVPQPSSSSEFLSQFLESLRWPGLSSGICRILGWSPARAFADSLTTGSQAPPSPNTLHTILSHGFYHEVWAEEQPQGRHRGSRMRLPHGLEKPSPQITVRSLTTVPGSRGTRSLG